MSSEVTEYDDDESDLDHENILSTPPSSTKR